MSIQDVLFNIRIVASAKDSREVFENPKAGYKGIGETKLWAEIPFNKKLTHFPDTLYFNIYDKHRGDTSSVGTFVLMLK